jgi:hypothetical protein
VRRSRRRSSGVGDLKNSFSAALLSRKDRNTFASFNTRRVSHVLLWIEKGLPVATGQISLPSGRGRVDGTMLIIHCIDRFDHIV